MNSDGVFHPAIETKDPRSWPAQIYSTDRTSLVVAAGHLSQNKRGGPSLDSDNYRLRKLPATAGRVRDDSSHISVGGVRKVRPRAMEGTTCSTSVFDSTSKLAETPLALTNRISMFLLDWR